MAFVNNYVPEPAVLESELYGPDPYDLNFLLSIPPELTTNKVRLVPFVPRVHAEIFLDGIRGHESMFRHMPIALEHPTDILRFVEKRRRDTSALLFAVIDTTRLDPNHPEWGGSLAGLFGILKTDKTRLTTQIGPAIVLPPFQRTGVGSHAVGLLLTYILELPPTGLGFRKVKWAASPINDAASNLVKRMGFKLEGVSRWKYVLPAVEGYQKIGKEARAGDAGNGLLGRDSNEWGLCWDDWEGGGRELVEHAFARKSPINWSLPSTMTFVNNYVAEPVILESELYGPEPYDLNFVFPIPQELSTGRLQLIPFIPRVHGKAFLDGIRGHESMFRHMPVALEHPTDVLRFVENYRRDACALLFAAIDATHPDPNHPEWGGSLAGLFGLLGTDKVKLISEIDSVVILPPFQRTHVDSHAVGLLLKYILELPPSGLGFRKARWTASPMNDASNNLAKRMGFKMEGVMRWQEVFPVVEGYQKLGEGARAGDAGSGLLGRDTNEWGLYWDDWEESGRELVERAFARVA